MAFTEDELCEFFANGVRDMPKFENWLLSRTKFASSAGQCKLLHEEQNSIRPRRRWWRHWWCHVPELSNDRETDVFMVFEPKQLESRFALHIECKKGNYRFGDGQAASYAPRAKHMLNRPEYLNHSDFTTILLAPQAFRTRFLEESSLFDSFLAFEDVVYFLPAFALPGHT